jgi:phenylacetate-CoA ligase
VLGTALAQLRVVASVAFGLPFAPWSLDRLVDAARATHREFGALGAEGEELVGGPALDDETRRAVQLRRFRAQARRAAGQTAHYRRLLADLGIDPRRLSHEDVARLPLTAKAALRDAPDAFVCRDAHPVLRAATTGTTDRPTQVAFSARELDVLVALSALSYLQSGRVTPADVVHLATGARACARVGALVHQAGVVAPAEALALLAQPLALPGKKPRPSVLLAHPSYLGELLEAGLRLGYRPADFGLETILTGGETVTSGLRRRLPALFGLAAIVEGYGMTETFTAAGQVCSAGHLHVHPAHALVEVVDHERGARTGPGAVGTLVVTPLPPFCETTPLLRYDTEDLVHRLVEPPTCELRALPATGRPLGKRRLAVEHGRGWTYPRDVLEALEAIDAVPLPARCGFWAMPGGVAVEVVVPSDRPSVRRAIEASLDAHGVPVQALRLVADRDGLTRPLPLRCDLKEMAFAPPVRSSPTPAPRDLAPVGA